MYPDLALEWYDKGIFIPKVYVEFKSTQIKSPSIAISDPRNINTDFYTSLDAFKNRRRENRVRRRRLDRVTKK